mmetsp:Transcript_71586/g.83274  ORF Transcript_71586/g.83274 Transcript_71586/m.83274 type:complete len:91 (-) Transcript_71586:7-279(-)
MDIAIHDSWTASPWWVAFATFAFECTPFSGGRGCGMASWRISTCLCRILSERPRPCVRVLVALDSMAVHALSFSSEVRITQNDDSVSSWG